jgi:Major Facilitator Superfamily
VLVAARAAQGVFGALLAPAALGLLTTTFTDPSERAKAFGIFGAIAGGGAAIGLLLGGLLTEYASWRWCLYVNLLFAIPAAVAAFSLLHTVVPAHRPRLDVPGTITATTGLFALVYGFSHAETTSWSDSLTVGMLASAAVLLTAFVLIQLRSKNPLLPLRIVLDRSRGGAYLAMGLAGAGMFGVFLFLTFYLQNTLGFSPIESGLAFLPMSAAIIATATTATTRLVPRVGPKPLVMTGMTFAAGAMAFFAQLQVDSTYALHILPGLVLLGVGLGLVFAPAFSTATVGVAHSDAGVASAMVNTSQQVGGSVGTALLSTLAGSAVTGYITDHGPQAAAAAAVHGYTTAFYWSAAIFALGAVVSGIVFRSGVPQVATAPATGAEPVLAH